jgi:CBS domain-containing membrane protein
MVKTMILAGLGSGATIGLLTFLPEAGLALLGSMGASAALCFGLPNSPLAAVRNTALSHPIAAAVSIGASELLAHSHVGPAAAVGAATVAMMATKTFHPPAGGTALIAATSPVGGLELLAAASCGAAVIAAFSHAQRLLLAASQPTK